MKNMRKLIPALCLLLVSAMMLGTSTFAWFSMNNKVTMTGMEVKTKVSPSLWIAADSLASTTRQAEENFKDKDTQVVNGILEPVSTADAETFHYTVDALKTGEKTSSGVFVKYNASAAASDATTYGDLFSETYGVTKSDAAAYNRNVPTANVAQPYVDYVFQLKATNTTDANQIISLTKLDLIYSAAEDAGKAFRAAIFVEEFAKDANPHAGVGTLKGIYEISGAANFDDKVVNSAGSLVAESYVNSALTIGEVTSKETEYYKVVVRLWLEGQDTTCKNDTYATLTETWALNLELTLGSSVVGVTNIIPHTTSGGVVTP